MEQWKMAKKITIKSPKERIIKSEEWVANREGTKRLTFDVPLSLHAQLKIASVKYGQTMGNIVNECLNSYLSDKET
jgi:hypothetical protein